MDTTNGQNPQRFWDEFKKVIGAAIDAGPEWKFSWRSGGAAWSAWIFPHLKEVFSRLGYSDPRQVQQEMHGRIDFTLVAGEASSASGGLAASDVEIAVEHENGPSMWLDEWQKLLRFQRATARGHRLQQTCKRGAGSRRCRKDHAPCPGAGWPTNAPYPWPRRR